MKKLLCVVSCVITSSAFALTAHNPNATPIHTGFYVGTHVGCAQSTYTRSVHPTPGESLYIEKTGLADRISAGYLITPNFAVEVGGAFLPNVKFYKPLYGGWLQALQLENRYLLDVFVKEILPLKNNFSVFGKAGLTWYHQEWIPLGVLNEKITEHAFTPALGVGISYQINSQLSADLDYTFYFRKGTKDDIARPDNQGHFFEDTHFLDIGLTYYFGS